jgi:hypothetical protein
MNKDFNYIFERMGCSCSRDKGESFIEDVFGSFKMREYEIGVIEQACFKFCTAVELKNYDSLTNGESSEILETESNTPVNNRVMDHSSHVCRVVRNDFYRIRNMYLLETRSVENDNLSIHEYLLEKMYDLDLHTMLLNLLPHTKDNFSEKMTFFFRCFRRLYKERKLKHFKHMLTKYLSFNLIHKQNFLCSYKESASDDIKEKLNSITCKCSEESITELVREITDPFEGYPAKDLEFETVKRMLQEKYFYLFDFSFLRAKMI